MNEEELIQDPIGASYDKPDDNPPALTAEEFQVSEAQYQEDQVAAEQTLEEESAALEDPRTDEGIGGVKGVLKELASIPSGGIQDTLSSGTTFVERTIDAVSGQRQKEIKEQGYYQPDFDPFTNNGQSEIITKT